MSLCSTYVHNFEYLYWIINRYERFVVGKDIAHGKIWIFIDYFYSSKACVNVFLSIYIPKYIVYLIIYYSFPNIRMRKFDTKDRGSGYRWPRVRVAYKGPQTIGVLCFISPLPVVTGGDYSVCRCPSVCLSEVVSGM